MNQTLRDRKALLVFVGPALTLYVMIVIVPIIWTVGYSLFEGSPITGFQFVGLGNYGKLWQDQDFINAFLFSARYALVVTAGQVGFGLLLALLYLFFLKRSSAFIRTLVFFRSSCQRLLLLKSLSSYSRLLHSMVWLMPYLLRLVRSPGYNPG